MKTIKYFLLQALFVYTLPMALSAQPMITTNEFYYIGDVIRMANCDAAGTSAGAAGANVTWDFSTLVATGSPLTSTVSNNTSTVFITSNILITTPTGLKQHVQENSSDTYLNGVENPSTGMVITYTDYNTSKRPFTYLSNYVDSYRVVIPMTSTTGTGHLNVTGDAYGTLVLPTGTYNNVLRIKKMQTEIDSSGSTVLNTTTVSYLWFDNTHNAPLLRIDSVIGIIGAGNTIMYLVSPTSVNNMQSSKSAYQCHLDDNGLEVNGDLANGKNYEVVVYNIIGAKVVSKEFIASGNSQRIVVDRPIVQGIYIVSIVQKDNPLTKEVVKVVKQ